ncbi:MAG: acyl carrier protein, partial [Betaproteobacteria bacterium]
IDAVDLAIKLQELTGKRIKPEDFKTVRSVGDVVATVKHLLAA